MHTECEWDEAFKEWSKTTRYFRCANGLFSPARGRPRIKAKVNGVSKREIPYAKRRIWLANHQAAVRKIIRE